MTDEATTQEPKVKEPRAKVQAVMPEGWPPVVGLTLQETAAALRIDVKTAQALISEQGLPARLCGKGWRVSPRALDDWLASGKGKGRKLPKLKGGKTATKAHGLRGASVQEAEADVLTDDEGHVVKDRDGDGGKTA